MALFGSHRFGVCPLCANEGFRTPATVQAASLRSAGIRNPQQEQTSANSIFLIFEQKRTAGAGWSAFGVAAIVGAGLCVAASLSALSLIAQNAPGN